MTYSQKCHTYNALHIYCRLRDLGVSKPIARKICQIFGMLINPFIYKGGTNEKY